MTKLLFWEFASGRYRLVIVDDLFHPVAYAD